MTLQNKYNQAVPKTGLFELLSSNFVEVIRAAFASFIFIAFLIALLIAWVIKGENALSQVWRIVSPIVRKVIDYYFKTYSKNDD